MILCNYCISNHLQNLIINTQNYLEMKYQHPIVRQIFFNGGNYLFATSNQEVDVTTGEESGWEFEQD